MMKNLIVLLIIGMLAKAKSYAQEYPLHYKGDVPIGAYYKDLDGELNKYLGLWKGNWIGKTVYIELKKIKHFNDGSTNPYYKDEIFGERKIIASDGTVEIDRITNFDYPNSEIWGMGIPTGVNGYNYPSLMFFPKICEYVCKTCYYKYYYYPNDFTFGRNDGTSKSKLYS